MENNFILMAASADHAVAYTIGLIIIEHYRLCTAVFHQWLLEYCPLFLAGRSNTYLWRHPTNYSPTVSNAIFKNRAQNIECNFGSVASSSVLLKPNVANILLFNFCELKFIQYGPITIAIDCDDLSLFIFEKNGPIMPLVQNPHQTVTCFVCVGIPMYACAFSVAQMLQFCLFT